MLINHFDIQYRYPFEDARILRLMRQMRAQGFELEVCQSLLDRARGEHPDLAEILVSRLEPNLPVVQTRHLAKEARQPFLYAYRANGNRVVLRPIASEQINVIVRQIRNYYRAPERGSEDLDLFLGETSLEWLGARPQSEWLQLENGIQRFEHSCIGIKTKKAQILFDPVQTLPVVGRPGRSSPRFHFADGTDAIFITHGHGDHFHLPSLLCEKKRSHCRIFVPDSEENILTPFSFQAMTNLFGLRTRVLKWHNQVVIGDIEVTAFPFRGEQPSRTLRSFSPEMRNHGNCYHIRTPCFSALILSDAGYEALGSVTDEIRQLRDELGPVDFVISCARDMFNPLFEGLEIYTFALTFGDLQESGRQLREGRLESATLGFRGVYEACLESGARYFLPYSHGFQGIGKPIEDIDWELGGISETQLRRLFMDCAKKDAAGTKCLAWNPGDCIEVSSHGEAHRIAAKPVPA